MFSVHKCGRYLSQLRNHGCVIADNRQTNMAGILSYCIPSGVTGSPTLGSAWGQDVPLSRSDVTDVAGSPLLSGHDQIESLQATPCWARRLGDYRQQEGVEAQKPPSLLDHSRVQYLHTLPSADTVMVSAAHMAMPTPGHKVQVGHGDEKIAVLLQRIGAQALDVTIFPEPMQSALTSFINRACILLEDMLIPEDGTGPVYFVILRDRSPNACFVQSTYGSEKIVGITLGLLELIENDEELGFILGHELEHGLSQLQEKINANRGELGSFLLQRSVENEADAKALVRRLIRKDKNPQAGIDVLTRLRKGSGDCLSQTHTKLTTRISVLEGAVAALVRLQGGNTEHRLDDGARSQIVLGNVKSVLFKYGALEAVFRARIERLLEVTGLADEMYRKIAASTQMDFERGVKSFADVYALRLAEMKSWLPYSHSKWEEWFILVKLQLAQNLHEEFERAKNAILGPDFVPQNTTQLEAYLSLEAREVDIENGDLIDFLKRRDENKESLQELESASATCGNTSFHQHMIKELKGKIAGCEAGIRLAKLYFEQGPALDAFIDQGYRKPPVGCLESKHGLFVDSLESGGLRLRIAHDMLIQAPKRAKKIRKDHHLNFLLSEKDSVRLAGLIKTYGYRKASPAVLEQILNKISDHLATSFEECLQHRDGGNRELQYCEIFHFIRDCLPTLISYFSKCLPTQTRTLIQNVIKKTVEIHCSSAVKIHGYYHDNPHFLKNLAELIRGAKYCAEIDLKECETSLLDKATAELIENLNSLNKESWLNALHGFQEQLDEMGMLYSIHYSQYANRAQGVDRLVWLIFKAAGDAGVSREQIKHLVYLMIPAMMPDAAKQGLNREAMFSDMIQLANNEKFWGVFKGQLDIRQTAHVYTNEPALWTQEETELNSIVEMLVANNEESSIPAQVRQRLRQIEEDKLNAIYDIFMAIPIDHWTLAEKTHAQMQRKATKYDPQPGQLTELALKRLSLERPWDLARAAFFLDPDVQADCRDAIAGFYKKSFQWFLMRHGSVTKASYEFWKAFDRAHLETTYSSLRCIEAGVSSSFSFVSAGKRTISDLSVYAEYVAGVEELINEKSGKYSSKGSASDELLLRCFARTLDDFFSDLRCVTLYPRALVARLLLFRVKNKMGLLPDKIQDVLGYLWQFRDFEQEVGELFLYPGLIRLCRYEGFKTDIAKWQIEHLPGFRQHQQDLKAYPAQLPTPQEVRKIVRDVRALLQEQFAEPTPASYSVLDFVEAALLPGENETRLLAELRLNENNWVQMRALYALDAPDFLAQGITTKQERLDLICYLIGVSPHVPHLQKYQNKQDQEDSQDQIIRFKALYQQNGALFQAMTLQVILGDELKTLQGTFVYDAVKNIIMDGAYEDPALSEIFDTYMNVLPAGERKILIALALANYDPTTGHSSFRRLLETSGPLGAKAAQNLVTSGLVTGTLRDDLMSSFDFALPPSREIIIRQLKQIFGDNYIKILAVGKLAGSGSLNYAVEVYVRLSTGEVRRVCVRIQKEHVSGLIENEHKVWLKVIEQLKAPDRPPQVLRYGMLIENLMQQAYDTLKPGGVELDLEQERSKAALGLRAYQHAEISPQTGLRVTAVAPDLEIQTMIQPEYRKQASVYAFVDHTKLDKIRPRTLRVAIAAQIVDAEIKALDEGRLVFDPDGHQGNWPVDLANGNLVRVDYAQITTITKEELDLFKFIFRALINPSRNAGTELKKLLRSRFTDIFEGEGKPQNLDEALDYVLSLDNIQALTKPMDRLLAIQNQLEVYYANHGTVIRFPLKTALSKLLGSFLRMNMYRHHMGDVAYLKRILAFLGIDYRQWGMAYVRGRVLTG